MVKCNKYVWTKKYNILYSLIFPSVVKMFTNINFNKGHNDLRAFNKLMI